MICPKHYVKFIRVEIRCNAGRPLRRCPACVEQARQKVLLEQARYARWHRGTFRFRQKLRTLLEQTSGLCY